MANHIPHNNKIPNGEGRTVFNRFENQNTLKVTGVRPIFADEDYTVASKCDFMVRLSDQDRQAEILKKRNTGLDGVDFGGPEFIRGKINLSKVAGYLLFRSTNKLRTWLDFEGKCISFHSQIGASWLLTTAADNMGCPACVM